jgi:hypothetical protein
LNNTSVAVKVLKDYRSDFKRGVPPRHRAPPAVLKELETAKALRVGRQNLSRGGVLKTLVHVAWGLRYLHSRGVVKPENVIVAGFRP